MAFEFDRGEHPKNAGDRAYGHGDEITMELSSVGTESATALNADGELPAGYFVDFDGSGGVARPDQIASSADVAYGAGDESTTDGTEAGYHAVLKESAAVGDKVTVAIRGAQRVAEEPATSSDPEVWPTVDTYNNGDRLIILR